MLLNYTNRYPSNNNGKTPPSLNTIHSKVIIGELLFIIWITILLLRRQKKDLYIWLIKRCICWLDKYHLSALSCLLAYSHKVHKPNNNVHSDLLMNIWSSQRERYENNSFWIISNMSKDTYSPVCLVSDSNIKYSFLPKSGIQISTWRILQIFRSTPWKEASYYIYHNNSNKALSNLCVPKIFHDSACFKGVRQREGQNLCRIAFR